MKHEQRNQYIVILLFGLTVCCASEEIDRENVTFSLLRPEAVREHYDVIIDYVTRLFCAANESYRFNHIYVERSVSMDLADKLITQINSCTTAGSLISR